VYIGADAQPDSRAAQSSNVGSLTSVVIFMRSWVGQQSTHGLYATTSIDCDMSLDAYPQIDSSQSVHQE
jgi:hypothetical protein